MRRSFFKAVINFMNVINNRLHVNYLLFEEGGKMYKEENVNYDSDLKIDKELPLSITVSKINILSTYSIQAILLIKLGGTIVDLVPSNLSRVLLSLVLSKDFSCSAETDAGDDVYSRTSTCDHLP